MKEYDIQFELSYKGADSDAHEIDLYDVSQALIGFQRSLAITTHLILNGKVITQAPSLRGAEIFALPAEEGSWKIKAGVLILGAGTAIYHLGTTPNNTPVGHLVYSAYDYIVSESLGVHVDYNKSLGQLYEENKKKKVELPVVREAQLDSVIEKCNTAITEIHRPIYKTQTAEIATISSNIDNQKVSLGPTLSFDTFRYMIEEHTEKEVIVIMGYVSSYNSNTYKGRIFVREEGRPISFVLTKYAQAETSIKLIVDSLGANALRGYFVEPKAVFFKVRKVTTKKGHLKSYEVLAVSDQMFSD